MRASPGLAWCAAGRAANSRWSTLTKAPSPTPRAETHSSSHDRLGWFVGDKRVQHLRMTSRMSPTSGLVADVAIVDALARCRFSGCRPSLPEKKSCWFAGALERGRIKGPWPLAGVSGGKT